MLVSNENMFRYKTFYVKPGRNPALKRWAGNNRGKANIFVVGGLGSVLLFANKKGCALFWCGHKITYC